MQPANGELPAYLQHTSAVLLSSDHVVLFVGITEWFEDCAKQLESIGARKSLWFKNELLLPEVREFQSRVGD